MKYALIIALFLLGACKGGNVGKEENKEETMASGTTVTLTPAQLKNADIETGKATRRDMAAVIKVSGRIDVPPQNMVSVSFPLGGYLKSTKLLPGMHINKGEVIATMEDREYIQLQQDYLTAKARQEYLESEYHRQKELNAGRAASDKVFQQAEADYKSNRIMISGLAQKLRLIDIEPERLTESNISRTVSVRAPIAGYVSAVNVNVGKYVNPSDVLFELVNPEDIHLVLTVFEKDINALSVGQKLVAYTNNNPDKRYPCEVILIGKDVGTDRSIQVHCHFDKYDHSLVPGMYMNAEIETNTGNALVLPEDAVVRHGNKQYVFAVLPGNKFEMKEVITGPSENGFTAIDRAEGMDLAQTEVVTKNAYTLLMSLMNKGEEE